MDVGLRELSYCVSRCFQKLSKAQGAVDSVSQPEMTIFHCECSGILVIELSWNSLSFGRPKTQKTLSLMLAAFLISVAFAPLPPCRPISVLSFKHPAIRHPLQTSWQASHNPCHLCNIVMKRSETAETAKSKKTFWLYGMIVPVLRDCQILSTFTLKSAGLKA